jgi:hypothetical protein
VTARQGKIIVAITVAVLTVLLLRAALRSGNWVGFVDTEVQLLVPMAIAWWLFSRGGEIETMRKSGETGETRETRKTA